jgi:ferredoxin
MITGWTMPDRKGDAWFKAMKKQDHNCARCNRRISNSISQAQKKRWMIEGRGYCGTCAILIKEGGKNNDKTG